MRVSKHSARAAPFPPDLSRRGQFRGQRLARDRDPLSQLSGIAQPASRFGATDPQLVGDHLVHRPAEVGRGLFGQARDEIVAGHYLLPSGGLQQHQCLQPTRGG